MTNSALDEKRRQLRANTEQAQRAQPRQAQDQGPVVSNGFVVPDLGADLADEVPPAYGELPDQISFSQPGFDAGAAITDTGRISISINTKNRRLADLLAPTINRQVSTGPPEQLPPPYIPASLGGQPGQTPPPQLNVVIQIVGSRGDVQPFVALGKVLRDTYGHRVRVATHPTFQSFVEEHGLEFFSIGGDPAELMAFMVKHPGLMPGFDAIKSGEVSKRRKGISEMLIGCWRSCIEAGDGLGPPPRPHGRDEPLDLSKGLQLPGNSQHAPFVADAIIANPPSFAHIHIAEKLGIPLHMMFTMPWTPTRAFPHPLADIQFSNADDVMTKYLTYTLVEMMTWQGLGDVINRFREKALDLTPLSLIWAPGLLNRLKVPYTYCWSPALIPKPNDWAWNVDVSGFFFLDLAATYNPDPDLEEFLRNGPAPVYIGFGSIVVDDPNKMTNMIFDAVKESGVRALVSKGWGGLGAEEMGVPENVFMLGNVPHDWLFQKVSCVVHHGGAGTTAAGIKAGKPTVVVPFFGDQPFWGSMIARANAGPDPIPYKELTASKLAEAITFCLKPETLEQAQIYGEKIREEKGTDVGGQNFHSRLDMDVMRCSIAPSRVAAWRVRRSKVRLSPLAAAALVDEGVLSYSDLKLYRTKEYNTEDQPPDPISAAACSLITDAGIIGMSIADMPREIFKSAKKGSNRGTPVEQPSTPMPQEESPGTGAGNSPSRSAAASTTDVSKAGLKDTPDSSDAGAGSSTAAMQSSDVPDSSSTHTTSAETANTGSTENRPNTRGSKTKDQPSRTSSPAGMTMYAAMGAGMSVGRVVTTGVKSPMNFCLGLAKGFRNIPRLYNDETVRPTEKVTGVTSGVKVAGKEFGYGLFDGISGLVTQPLKGAQKGGAGGLVKGFGKGIGGLISKPAAGFWGIPAYTMQGVHAEVSKLFARSSQNYIVSSRIAQGQRDLNDATREERQDIVARWQAGQFDLKQFNQLKKKETGSRGARAGSATSVDGPSDSSSAFELPGDATSTVGRATGVGEKTSRLESLRQGHLASASSSALAESSGNTQTPDDAEFEQAIQASVRETSKGNPEEDAMIETAIRNSVNAVRQQGSLPDPQQYSGMPEKGDGNPDIFSEKEYKITDEEYQALIERAIQHSMSEKSPYEPQSGVMDSGLPPYEHSQIEDDDELRRAIEASKGQAAAHLADDEDFKKAIAASREAADAEKSQKTEEDIVMEYVKKQSLAEDGYRNQASKGKGKEVSEDDDEELRRAMEESLKMSHDGQSGPSGVSGD